MILNFKHKGLELLWTKGKTSLLPADQIRRITLILQVMDGIVHFPEDLRMFPNWKAHPLKGNKEGEWSLTVKNNWRIVFKYDGANTYDVDYILSLKIQI